MVFLSFKISFRKAAAVAGTAAFIILIVIYAVMLRSFGRALPPGETDYQRRTFLQSFGWEICGDSDAQIFAESVLIPADFDSVMESYNRIQLSQGCSLWDYAGKYVTLYSYPVSNCPENCQDIRANLLVYRGNIIGGDISQDREGGYLGSFDADSVYLTEN